MPPQRRRRLLLKMEKSHLALPPFIYRFSCPHARFTDSFLLQWFLTLFSYRFVDVYRGTLYTLVVSDPKKTAQLRQTVPQNLIIEVPAKN